jgi:hypothetical protein
MAKNRMSNWWILDLRNYCGQRREVSNQNRC